MILPTLINIRQNFINNEMKAICSTSELSYLNELLELNDVLLDEKFDLYQYQHQNIEQLQLDLYQLSLQWSMNTDYHELLTILLQLSLYGIITSAEIEILEYLIYQQDRFISCLF